MGKLSRREFMKLGWGIFGGGLASNVLLKSARISKSGKTLPNIIVLVCDAMTARNLSVYGYPRKTTPNLEKLGERAFIYHKHYANGNFTVPGASSLLTGLKPWTHRAINHGGIIKKEFAEHNIFRFIGDDYFKMAFSQNYWAVSLLNQFSPDIDSLLPMSEFGLINGAISQKFKDDSRLADQALVRMLYSGNSLLLSFINSLYYQSKVNTIPSEDYPTSLPRATFYDSVFTMKGLFDGIADKILELDEHESPFFSYFHIYPPHNPYTPDKDFMGMFDNDGYEPVVKREHVLSIGSSQSSLNNERNKYDAFLANVDLEIGHLLSILQEQGVLEHTYFIITADHGEMFERGTNGHFTGLLYEPVIRIPLMIFVPGNETRRDFLMPSSNIDLFSTILNLAGADIPASNEGNLLLGFGGVEDPDRSIITMEAKESSAFKPFTKATYSIVKGNYKLIYYHGYVHKYQDYFEFYDLQEDPEEIQDKYSKQKFKSIISDMKAELFSAMDEANKRIATT
ncbi:MAG: sulfatase-like hydrolase/transferase [Chloroflexi bacterium]|nr:sulfatase-like hydrolase/transferase [Chloroflexota bacterium]